jgi:hypothetical protein
MTLVMCWSDLENHPILVSAQVSLPLIIELRSTRASFTLSKGASSLRHETVHFFRKLQVEHVS